MVARSNTNSKNTAKITAYHGLESNTKITRGKTASKAQFKTTFTKNDIPLSEEEKVHLNRLKVSENDPGYYLSWNLNTVNRIVCDLQSGVLTPNVPSPSWLQINSSK